MIEMINFTELNNEEKEEVLEWRNDAEIRKYMLDPHIIKPEEHYSFIDSLRGDKNKVYYLIKEDNEKIGVINLVDIDFKELNATAGMYLNPSLIGSGKGRVLVDTIIEVSINKYHLKKIFLKVLKNNNRAIKLYNKAGFYKIDEKSNFYILERII